jgi:hypothetical protein
MRALSDTMSTASELRAARASCPPVLRRSGITLVEVLVAIFIMGIGMMSLLVLFPLGALNMANAIKDDQCGHAASNANALAVAFNLRIDPNVQNAFTNGTGAPLPALVAGWTGPGYPVYVDPAGVGSFGPSLPAAPSPPSSLPVGMPRVAPNYVLAAPQGVPQATQQYFSLLDNMTFYPTGVPPTDPNYNQFGRPYTPGGDIERPAQSSYSWAYLLRQPQWSVPAVVNLTVVVYKQRTTAVQGETVYPLPGAANMIQWVQNAQTVSVIYAPGPKPSIKKGGWVLDATMVDDQGNPEPHGFFYRVASVSDNPTVIGQLDIELENPIQQSSIGPTTGVPYGVLIVLDGVVEVFNKGT